MADDSASPYAVRVSAASHRIGRDGAPLLEWLDVELTERCNNNCIHCCINLPEDDPARARELSTREVERVLTEAAALGTLTVRFTGGEPLLREDFPELYLFARRLGLRVMLFTNARLVTPELADLLARYPPLEKVEVTVYGVTEEVYEAVSRVKGSFEEFRRGVDLLLDRQVPFVVKGVLLPPNRDEMERFEAWAATLPAMDQPPRYSLLLDLRCRRDSPEKNRPIRQLRLSPDEGVSFLSRYGKEYRSATRAFCRRFLGPPGDGLFPCEAGLGGCVDAYGRLQSCMMLRHPDTVYDLGAGSLADAINRFFPTIREMKATDPEYLARCARCFLKGLCEQCPAKSWMEHGTLDTPVEYLCEVAHAQAIDLGLLRDGERAWEIRDWRQRLDRTSAGADG
jgi:radical SAM protein with 4Fe4S-binding SPASM domain